MFNWFGSFRRAELRGVSRQNPQEIVGLYRAAAGFNSGEPLPRGVTANEMVESILDNEAVDSLSSGVLRAIAG